MTTKTRNRELSQGCEADEAEARMLFALDMARKHVKAMTSISDLTAESIDGEFHSAGDGPYDAGTAAKLLGLNYRTFYHHLAAGDIKSSKRSAQVNGSPKSERDVYSITKAQLQAFVRSRLAEDGERRARFLLYSGVAPAVAAIRGVIDAKRAKAMLRELERAGIGPTSEGPYKKKQVALLLGIQPRLVGRYCQQGRLGVAVEPDSDFAVDYGFPGKYLIARSHLLAFGAKERRVGKPGQENRRRERSNGKR